MDNLDGLSGRKDPNVSFTHPSSSVVARIHEHILSPPHGDYDYSNSKDFKDGTSERVDPMKRLDLKREGRKRVMGLWTGGSLVTQ